MKENNKNLNEKILNKIFSKAIFKCKEDNRKKGIPNAFLKNGKVYFEMPDGKITDINPFDN